MGKSKTAEKLIAQERYINTGMSIEDIAEMLHVRPATVSAWKAQGGWETLKTAKKVTRPELISNFYQAIATMQRQISDRSSPHNVPTSKEADIISKLTSQIEKLEKKSSISDYINAFEEFISYLRSHNSSLLQDFARESLGFIEMKAKELEDK